MQMQLNSMNLTRWKMRNNFIDSIHNRNVPDRPFKSDNSVVKSTRFLDNKSMNPIIKNWWNTKIFMFLTSNGFGDQKNPWCIKHSLEYHKTLIFSSRLYKNLKQCLQNSFIDTSKEYLPGGNDGFCFMLNDGVLYWLECTLTIGSFDISFTFPSYNIRFVIIMLKMTCIKHI